MARDDLQAGVPHRAQTFRRASLLLVIVGEDRKPVVVQAAREMTDVGTEHELAPGGCAWVDAPTVRKIRNLSDSEDATYLVVGGKDGYVGRDGALPEDEVSRFGDDAPPGA